MPTRRRLTGKQSGVRGPEVELMCILQAALHTGASFTAATAISGDISRKRVIDAACCFARFVWPHLSRYKAHSTKGLRIPPCQVHDLPFELVCLQSGYAKECRAALPEDWKTTIQTKPLPRNMTPGKDDERRTARAKAMARKLEENPRVLYADASLLKQ
ncbi:hypothetical protein MTO96_027203 [Rhipicephalus appendiculatus]